MRGLSTATVLAFGAVAAVSVALGCVAAVLGLPANYGLSLTEALSFLDDRPIGTTIAWVAYSVAIVLIALFRAWWLARNSPTHRSTVARGAIWLWGAIAGPWLFVLVSWDLQIWDHFESDPVTHGSILLRVSVWWWLGGLIALVVGVVWSTALALADTDERATTTDWPVGSAPSVSAPPLLRDSATQ